MARHKLLVRAAGIVASLLIIGFATLSPRGGLAADGFAFCLPCGVLGTLDLLLNTALFLPLGAALAASSPRPANVWHVALACALLSLAIELAQLALPGRDPSLSDVVGNSLGGALGALMVLRGPLLAAASEAVWNRVAWYATAFSVAVLAFGAWAVQWNAPRETYYVQWEPERPGYVPFDGRLLELTLNGLPLRPGQVLTAESLPADLLAGHAELGALMLPGSTADRVALVARVALARDELLMLGTQGDASVVRYRSNAKRAGLRSPVYALTHALGGDPVDSIRLQTVIRAGAVRMRATRASGETERIEHRVSAARFWATLLPVEVGLGAVAKWLDLAWLLILTTPLAYASTRARRRSAIAAPLTLFAAIAVLALYQPALAWWPHLAALSAGALLGYWLGGRRVLP